MSKKTIKTKYQITILLEYPENHHLTTEVYCDSDLDVLRVAMKLYNSFSEGSIDSMVIDKLVNNEGFEVSEFVFDFSELISELISNDDGEKTRLEADISFRKKHYRIATFDIVERPTWDESTGEYEGRYIFSL